MAVTLLFTFVTSWGHHTSTMTWRANACIIIIIHFINMLSCDMTLNVQYYIFKIENFIKFSSQFKFFFLAFYINFLIGNNYYNPCLRNVFESISDNETIFVKIKLVPCAKNSTWKQNFLKLQKIIIHHILLSLGKHTKAFVVNRLSCFRMSVQYYTISIIIILLFRKICLG